MLGTLEVRLGVSALGVTPRAYTSVLSELTLSLEELDRLSEPNPKRRVSWHITNTTWFEKETVVHFTPDLSLSSQRSFAEIARPGDALINGIRSLQTVAEIPRDFTEGIVKRVAKVGDLTTRAATGIQSVDVATFDDVERKVAIDDVVDANARRAVSPASYAYGSLVGMLDVISARTSRIRIGLVPAFGPPISCVVNKLDRDEYLSKFGERVLVAGVVRRNGAGQVIRIDADSLELAPRSTSVQARELRGLLKASSPTVSEFMEIQRGR
jgi:hypothetical protein